jgi:hypothetical protein
LIQPTKASRGTTGNRFHSAIPLRFASGRYSSSQGTLFLTIPYALGVTGVAGNAALGGAERENWLLLPGVGPLILMAETTRVAGNVFLALDALAQLGGVAAIAYGITSPTTVLVRDRPALTFLVTPLAGPGGTGVGVVGSF